MSSNEPVPTLSTYVIIPAIRSAVVVTGWMLLTAVASAIATQLGSGASFYSFNIVINVFFIAAMSFVAGAITGGLTYRIFKSLRRDAGANAQWKELRKSAQRISAGLLAVVALWVTGAVILVGASVLMTLVALFVPLMIAIGAATINPPDRVKKSEVVAA